MDSPKPKNCNVYSMKFYSKESKAFSKSSNTRSPGIFSLFVFSSRSKTSLLQSPIYLPLINPDCDSEISLSSTDLILAAIAEEPIFRSTDKSEIGRQFLRYSLFLPSFGIQVIMPCFCVTDNFCIAYP